MVQAVTVNRSLKEQSRNIALGGSLKLKEQLNNIKRVYPRRNRYGQLTPDRTGKKSWKRVTLFTLFVSTDNTHMIRPHAFKKNVAMTAREWAHWFSNNLREVYVNGILPGIGIRTGKQWVVQRVIGWAAQDAESILRETQSSLRKIARKRVKLGVRLESRYFRGKHFHDLTTQGKINRLKKLIERQENAIAKSGDSAVAGRWHKAKKKGRKNG